MQNMIDSHKEEQGRSLFVAFLGMMIGQVVGNVQSSESSSICWTETSKPEFNAVTRMKNLELENERICCRPSANSMSVRMGRSSLRSSRSQKQVWADIVKAYSKQ
jgi:hypothetical protein